MSLALLLAVLAAVPAEPPFAETYRQSYALEARGDAIGSLQVLEAIGARGAQDYVYQLRRGWLLYLAGRYAESVQAYDKATALEPKASEPRLGAMLPLMALRRWVDATRQGEQVLTLAPGDFTALSRLAYIHYQLAGFPTAEAYYRKALAQYPANTEMRAGLGWSLLKLNRFKEARAELERVLVFAPDHASARAGLALLP